MKIIEDYTSLGLWYIKTTNDSYEVEFNDKNLVLRNKDQSTIEILPRDRSFGGVSDREIIVEFITNLEK